MEVYFFKEITRDFHLVIENLSLYTKKYFGANINIIKNRNELISLSKDNNFTLTDAQLVIYYPEKDILKAIDFSDRPSNLVNLFISRNNPDDVLVYSQQAHLYIPDNGRFKSKSSIYTPSIPYLDLENYYVKRSLQTSFIDKFFFRGNVNAANRYAVNHLKNEELFDGGESQYHINYFNELIQYKIGLSIPGIGELCFRDIEYMALGIPMMRFEYITQLDPPLIPNYHYISIDRIDTEEDKMYNGGVVVKEREADQRHADAYIKRFKEVKDDIEFLEFVSKNARKYYESYLHPLTRIEHIVNLLEIK